MKRLLLSLLFALTMSACLVPAAQAAILAGKVGTVFIVGSNDSGTVNETYTLRDEGSNVVVKFSPGTTSDPDGAGSECSVSPAGDEVFCSRSGTSSVQIIAGLGVDTIKDNSTQGPSQLEGGSGNDQITTGAGASAVVLRSEERR